MDLRLRAAMEGLIAEGHPFAAISVERLARHAGIGRATFYLYFRDKSALLTHLLACISEEVVASGGAWFEDARGSGPAEVEAAVAGVVQTFQRHHAVLAAVAQTAPFDAEVGRAHEALMARLCAASRRAVATVRTEGRASAAADDALADLLTWTVALACTRSARGLQGAAREALIRRLGHLCASALFAPLPMPRVVQGARSKSSRKP